MSVVTADGQMITADEFVICAGNNSPFLASQLKDNLLMFPVKGLCFCCTVVVSFKKTIEFLVSF